MFSKLKASGRCSDDAGSLEAESHSNEESETLTHVQGPKVGKTVSISIDKNDTNNEPSDLSASRCMRGQSLHSSQRGKTSTSSVAKEDSVRSSTRVQRSRSKVNNPTLRMFVQSQLKQYEGRNGKYNGIIKILADVGFLQFCYLLIKGKPGNMSHGATKETLDGITYEWFDKVAKELLTGKYKFTPARRVMIPKPGKKKRPLGVGSPREKIIQKGLQIILETIFEPKFLDCSHGFRPNRSTHSALRPLYLRSHQMTWVVQGDISKCFDKIPHIKIMNILKKEIACLRTLSLIEKALQIGYIDPKTKRRHTSDMGTPQGSVLSPLLANIVLHELDKFVADSLIPQHHRGTRRRTNPEYNKYAHIRFTKKNVSEVERMEAYKKMITLPRMDTHDPNYRRSMYIRYADDFVFLLEGPITEAKAIKESIKEYLRDHTGLELNDEKTVITPAVKGFDFLGAKIRTLKHVGYRMKTQTTKGRSITMRANVRARVNIPTNSLIEKLIKSKIVHRSGNGTILAKPITGLVNLDHSTILQFFNHKINGLMNYYSFAANRVRLLDII